MKGDHEHACGKLIYATRTEARLALKAMSRHRGTKGMCVYRCPRCSKWHLGHPGKSKKWRRTRESGGYT